MIPGLVAADDPVLRMEADPVVDFVHARDVVRRLREACVAAARAGRPAAGMAAPQIGESIRVFVKVVSHPGDPILVDAFVNPSVIWKVPMNDIGLEGCLSLPEDVRVMVERPSLITATWTSEFNTPRPSCKLEGRAARVFLHELDHLDGVLITDRGET